MYSRSQELVQLGLLIIFTLPSELKCSISRESVVRIRSNESFYLQRFIVYVNKGDHGYHNTEMDMKTIFRAFGPNFKKDFLSEPFDSVHIYPLMCKLLEIEPAPHNGSLTVTEGFLQPGGPNNGNIMINLCSPPASGLLQDHIAQE